MAQIKEAHLPCPACGSHDALTLYEDGSTYCFSCNRNTQPDVPYEKPPVKKKSLDMLDIEGLLFSPLRKRGITKATCDHYSYGTGTYKNEAVQVANYFNSCGELVGQKLRFKDKKFLTLGHVGDTFYGQHMWTNGKKLVITEGEIDCLTVAQLNGNKYPVVSLPNGCQSAKRVFEKNLEWLNGFEEVIVMFDMDTPGQAAVQSICGILPLGKLKIATLPLKDPNECLLAGKANEVMSAIWQAKEYRPDGIINGAELWEVIDSDKDEEEGYKLPWDIPLETMTQGLHKGELIVITAGTGIGKTTFVRQIAHHLGLNLHLRVGLVMLEENVKRTARGLMALTACKRLALNRNLVSEEEYKKIFDATLGGGNFAFYQHFGSMETNVLLQRIRYLAVVEKCDFIVLDHITIAISGLDIDNERKATDILMTQLRSLVEETGVGLMVISHLSRREGVSAEEGGKITLAHLRGSHALGQLSDGVWALERNQQAEDDAMRNVVTVRILKNRRTGETGLAGYLAFNKETDHLEKAAKPKRDGTVIFDNGDGTNEQF